MVQYFGRAGAQSWGVAGAWSNTSGGASNGLVPDATIDCVLDANSGNMTIDGTSGSPSLCRSLTCTGYTGTLTHASAKQINIGDGSGGSLLLVSGMTYAPNSAAITKFITTTTANITTGTKSIANQVIFDGAGGQWTLQDNFSQGSSATLTLTNGTIVLNGKTLQTGLTFTNSGTGTTAIDGSTASSQITLQTSGTAGVSFDCSASTGLTVTSTNLTISFPQTTGSATFDGGGKSWNIGTATARTTGSVTVKNATFATLTLKNGANQFGSYKFGAGVTVTGTLDVTGSSGTTARNLITSDASGTRRTVTVNTTVTAPSCDWQDIDGAGTASWNLSAVTNGSGDCGNNNGITFTAATTQYWVPSGGTSTGSVSATTRWATSPGGTAGSGVIIPLPQTTLRFDGSSIDAGSRVITFDMDRIGPMNWTNATNTPAMSLGGTQHKLYGDIILISGMTITNNNGTQSYNARSNISITTAGQTIGTSTITFDNAGCTITLNDDFTCSSGLVFSSGTVSSVNYGFTGQTTTTVNGGTQTVYKLAGSTAHSYTAGTTTVGGGGISGTTFSNSGGNFTLNGASTGMTGNVTFSGGVTTLNANFTTSASTLTSSGGQLTGSNATLTMSGTGYNIVFPASGGSSGGAWTFVG